MGGRGAIAANFWPFPFLPLPLKLLIRLRKVQGGFVNKRTIPGQYCPFYWFPSSKPARDGDGWTLIAAKRRDGFKISLKYWLPPSRFSIFLCLFCLRYEHRYVAVVKWCHSFGSFSFKDVLRLDKRDDRIFKSIEIPLQTTKVRHVSWQRNDGGKLTLTHLIKR